ncbi:CheR family methyltransferase [Salipiger mucosus]|uniref:Chemotaxis protein methyltransferase n=1 Tax=Salipiger mucosus DSM 16094 TaxID=1123237 RepID=S9R0A4_9RHOB|nr:protein-glutamate O-methyltransferase [Salipiger mucosus]EPX85363.1 Chemotaxis protein methyltransferase CheR [Salipiger mucosus DSM 16094]
MILATAETGTGEFGFSDADFRDLARLARAEYGLSLADSKKPLVYSRLARRLRARGVEKFQDYMALLNDDAEADERLELITALTTNVTSFFRERHHFDMLASELLPDCGHHGRIRLWSAGCSSGQEAYSIAMTLRDSLADIDRRDVRVLATDIDPAIVRRAQNGRYPKEEQSAIPAHLSRQFTRRCNSDPDHFEMTDDVGKLVTFAELNLMTTWPFRGPFDGIFCRNVAIYFDQDTQQKLWTRFAEMLRPGGYLFIGHSERVSGPATASFRSVGVTAYRKIVPSEQSTTKGRET